MQSYNATHRQPNCPFRELGRTCRTVSRHSVVVQPSPEKNDGLDPMVVRVLHVVAMRRILEDIQTVPFPFWMTIERK